MNVKNITPPPMSKDQLKAEIVKVCPELMELDLWCTVKISHEEIEWTYCWIWYVDWPNLWKIIKTKDDFLTATLYELEILGHPITIAHLLRWLWPDYAIDGGWHILMMHQEWLDMDLDFKKLPCLNLSLSVLEQEDSVIEGLLKLK